MGMVGFGGFLIWGFLCVFWLGAFCCFFPFASWAFIHMVIENIKVSQIEKVNHTQEKKKQQSDKAT